MNRRQAKKAYKKKYGHNPPKTEVRFYPKHHAKSVIKVMDLLPGVVERATARIQTMPEEDFIKFLETPGMEESTKVFARLLRAGKGKEGTEKEWNTQQKIQQRKQD